MSIHLASLGILPSAVFFSHSIPNLKIMLPIFSQESAAHWKLSELFLEIEAFVTIPLQVDSSQLHWMKASLWSTCTSESLPNILHFHCIYFKKIREIFWLCNPIFITFPFSKGISESLKLGHWSSQLSNNAIWEYCKNLKSWSLIQQLT